MASFYDRISLEREYLFHGLNVAFLPNRTLFGEQGATATEVPVTFNNTTPSYYDVATDYNVTSNISVGNLCQNLSPKGWYYDMPNIVGVTDFNLIKFFTILGFIGYLLVYMICSFVFDCISFILCTISMFTKRNTSWNKFRGKLKDRVVASLFYKLCQFSFNGLSLLYIQYSLILPFLFPQLKQAVGLLIQLVVQVGLILTCFFSAWSILYFVQLLPYVGPFVNCIQKMLGIMVTFTFVYFIMMFPYPHAFLSLLRGDSKCSIEGFETLWDGIYTSFQIMLNMVDIHSYKLDGI